MDRPGATSEQNGAGQRTGDPLSLSAQAMRLAMIRRLLADRRVTRMEIAYTGFNLAEYGVWVAVLVYAYERGGTLSTAALAVAQLVPAGLLAPILAREVDRHGAAAALRWGYWWQALSFGATSALLLSGAPNAITYTATVVAAVAVTSTRPAQAALAPLLVERPQQLPALNVVSGWVENGSMLAGPALAGVLIAVDGPGAAVGFFALCMTASALLVAELARSRVGAPRRPVEAEGEATARLTLRAGLDALRHDSGLTALITLLGMEYFVIGALDVLLVVLGIDVLGLGPSGPGYLNAAFGAGGVTGSIAALSLIGRRRLAVPLLGAAIGWGLLLIVLGSWPTALGAFLLLAGAGVARSVLDVSSRTILVRAAPGAVRGRVFGLLEGAAMLGLALGSLLVPVLSTLSTAGVALVATGALMSAVVLTAATRVQGVDALSAPDEHAEVPALAHAVIS
jgi:Transmembrane secretion effector